MGHPIRLKPERNRVTLRSRDDESTVTVGEVILAYWEHARGYYVKDGKPSSEQKHLKRGRTDAPENRKVLPAPDENIEAVLPLVSAEVAAMIRLQLLTAMRPGEVVIMRADDLDRPDEVWLYRPHRHKTEHHGHDREVFIGPEAQEVLRPFLEGEPDGYLFSPRKAEEARSARRRLTRKSPLTPSQRKRTRKPKRKRAPRERYDTASYGRAIKRACERGEVPGWHPNQLRHNAATRLRRDFGIEAARVVLGHKSAAVTEIYAEMDRGKAVEIMGKVG